MAAPHIIGQKLGHYSVLEILGAGGMGEVYRAHDEQLGRDVALKILPTGSLNDESARRQFHREALVLAKLNHPHIETVFEFSTQDGVDFLAMELIRGVPLSEKLKAGPMPESEVVALALQLAEGLQAAGEEGVVHRDLKPGNLMLSAGGRLKILDFGLAKFTHPVSDTDITRSLSGETQSISGTVPYMAPEQLRGAAIDGRTDIYAAGAVLYEMATGTRAFPQQQSAEVIGAILHQPPESPRTRNSRISAGLQPVILKCLEKDPGRRYQSAGELFDALQALRRTPRWTGMGWAAVGLVAILGIGIAIGLNLGGLRERVFGGHRNSTAALESSVRARHAVAVLGFKNVSGKPDAGWLSTGIAEMLTTELGTGNQIRTISAENVVRAKRDLSIPDTDTLARDTLAHLRKNLGADYVVLGSYIDMGQGKDSEVRVDLRLQNAANGETVGLISETGKEDELFDLVTRAGTSLREKLGIAPMSATETSAVRSLVPDNPDASKLYAEGLSDLRNFNPLAARDLLEKAVNEAPSFALAHSALSDAWAALGYDAKATEEAKKALDSAGGLDREQHLVVEGHYYEAARQWSKAIETYRALWSFAPDNPDYGLRLAQCQASDGEGKESLQTIAALRQLPSPLNEDPRIDLAEEIASRGTSNFKQALAASLAATQKGQAIGAQLLVARAEMAQARSYYSLGDLDHALHAAQEAERLYTAAGDQSGEAAALHSVATVLSDKGDNAGAKKMDEQALATCRSLGNQKCVADTLNSIGVVLKDQADFAGAQNSYRLSLAIRRELGDRSGEAISLNNIAVVFYQQGQLANASRMYEQALALARQIGEKRGIARALTNLGIAQNDEGQLLEAQKACEESIAIRRQIGDRQGLGVALNNYGVLLLELGNADAAGKAIAEQLSISQQTGNQRGLAYALYVNGNILEAEDKLADAEQAYEQALAIREKIGENTTTEENKIALAELAMQEGHSGVESSLQEVLAQARRQHEPDIETFAEVTLSQALLASGKAAEAAKEIAPVEKSVARSEERLHRIDVSIAAARVYTATHEWSKAEHMLTTAISDSKRFACRRCELEARLALAELKTQRGDRNARAFVAALSKDARTRGLLLIARKASALSASHNRD